VDLFSTFATLLVSAVPPVDHQGREWRHPGFLRHVLGRLYRMRAQPR